MPLDNEPDFSDDLSFNDNFSVNIDPKEDIDITAAATWSEEQVADYSNRKKRKNMRELIMYVRREIWLRKELAKNKQKAAKKIIMQAALAFAGVVGLMLGTLFMAKFFGVVG